MVSTFCLTKAETSMKHGSVHESGTADSLFQPTTELSVSRIQETVNPHKKEVRTANEFVPLNYYFDIPL